MHAFTQTPNFLFSKISSFSPIFKNRNTHAHFFQKHTRKTNNKIKYLYAQNISLADMVRRRSQRSLYSLTLKSQTLFRLTTFSQRDIQDQRVLNYEQTCMHTRHTHIHTHTHTQHQISLAPYSNYPCHRSPWPHTHTHKNSHHTHARATQNITLT